MRKDIFQLRPTNLLFIRLKLMFLFWVLKLANRRPLITVLTNFLNLFAFILLLFLTVTCSQ